MNTEQVLEAYIECALWTSPGNDVEFLDMAYGPDDLASEARLKMAKDVQDFLDLVSTKVEDLDEGQVGHDFWLTRNGHGTGFWDRGMGEVGDELTKMAQSFGSSDLYVGDDGKVYVS